jgi:hypothetical protein
MYQVKTLIAADTGVRQHRESETGSLLPPSLLLMKREVTHILVRDRFGGMLLNRLPPCEEDAQKDKHQSADGIPSHLFMQQDSPINQSHTREQEK